MASPPWFYYPFEELDDATIEISGKEVNHVLGARRMHPGDELVLSNGSGKLAHCTLLEADKKSRSLRLYVSLVADVEPPEREIILASALPKGDRLSTMLDMSCQLGISRLQPLQFERSVSKWSDKLKGRCERVVIEACKQSKTARLPEIMPLREYSEYMRDIGVGRMQTLLADKFGRPIDAYRDEIDAAESLRLVVGPEGGLSGSELNLAREQGVGMVRLAASILRIETAAVAAVAALAQVVHEPT